MKKPTKQELYDFAYLVSCNHGLWNYLNCAYVDFELISRMGYDIQKLKDTITLIKELEAKISASSKKR